MRIPKVLLVEDDPDDRELFAAAVSQASISVELCYANDGVDALEKLSGEACNDVQLILLDINMPRMDGWEVLARLKGDFHFKDIPVIIFSTSNGRADIDKALKLGALAFVSKPSKFDHIVDLVSLIMTSPKDKLNRILKDYPVNNDY